MADSRAARDRQRAQRKFDEWLQKKDKLDRGLKLLLELDQTRADDEEMWLKATLSCCAIDKLVFMDKPNFQPSRTKSAGSAKIECMRDLWLKWTREHHVFTFVKLSENEAEGFSSGAKHQTMERDDDGNWTLMSLQYFFPAKPKKKGDKPRPLTSDQKQRNRVFKRKCAQTWQRMMYEEERGTLKSAENAEVLRIQQMREEANQKKGDDDPRSAAEEDPGAAEREAEAIQRSALNKFGVRQLAQWVEEDIDKQAQDKAAEKDEKLKNARDTHRGFVKMKDKLRIPIAALSQADHKPGAGGWKPPRFDFGGGKSNVRPNKNSIARTSVDLMANSGLKYIHALSKGKQGRDGDLERCKAQLQATHGRDVVKNARREQEDRARGAEEAFSEWLEQKRKKEEAVSHVGLIDKPGMFEDGDDFDHWINVGKLLKAVDQNLYQSWVDWSKPEGTTEPFRNSQVSITFWDSFSPIGCDVCNRVFTGLQGTLTKLLRPGVDYKAAFERQFERVWKRKLAEDDDYRLTAKDKEAAQAEMKLDKRQMRTLLSRELGIVMQPDEMRRLIDAFDENHDGDISMKEFLKFTGESRSANRGDTKQRLRSKCTWQTTCSKTGMPNAFTVYTVTAENAKEGDDVISWTLSNGEKRQRTELPERRRREDLLRRHQALPAGAADDDDDDDDDDDENAYSSDEDDEEGEGRRGGKRGAAIQKGKCQVAELANDHEQQDSALRKLRRLSRENRESKQLEDIMANGEPPAAPRLWAAGPDHPDVDCESEDALTRDLWLCWRPTPGSLVAFYSLEFSGPEGSREQRQNLFREIKRDPPDANGEPEYMFHVENLEPNTTYAFRLRACNGFGPGPFVHKDFTTRPEKSPTPELVKSSPTTVTLRWKFNEQQMEKMDELKRIFDGIDADGSGDVSREELITALESKSSIMEFLTSAIIDDDVAADALGAPRSVFDAIETDDNETLSWDEFRGFFQNLGFADGGQSCASTLSNRTPGEMLTRYVLERCESFGDEVYKKVWTGGIPEATLTGLSPGTSYRFRVFSINREGSAGEASESVIVNTMLARPEAPVVHTKPGSITSTSISLRWVGTRPDAKGTRSKKFVDTMLAQWTMTEGASDEGVDVRTVFDKYDGNGDGSMDTAELGCLLEDLGVTPTESRIREAFDAMDRNRDRKIDFEEFNRWWTGENITYAVKRDAGLTADDVSNNIVNATLALKTRAKHGSAGAEAKEEKQQGNPRSAAIALPPGPMSFTCFRGSAKACKISGLEPNSLYHFRLRVSSPSSFSTLSASTQVMTAPITPHAPVTINSQQRSVRLKWYAGPGGAHKYIVEQQFVEALDAKSDRAAAAFAKRMADQKSWSTAYDGVENVASVIGLYPNSVYKFRVQSVNRLGVASASSEMTMVNTCPKEGQLDLRPANAAEAFTIECTGDVVAGDTILFQERLYVDENDKLIENAGGAALLSRRGGQERLDMSVSSIGSVSRHGGTRGSFIGERTVAALVLKESMSASRGGETVDGQQHQQWPRRLRMEVVWSTVSRSAATKHVLAKGVIIERAERKLFAFETFRTPWEQDHRRKRAEEEVRVTDRRQISL